MVLVLISFLLSGTTRALARRQVETQLNLIELGLVFAQLLVLCKTFVPTCWTMLLGVRQKCGNRLWEGTFDQSRSQPHPQHVQQLQLVSRLGVRRVLC